MNLNRYEYLPDKNFYSYIFYSDGPNGVIKKVVTFSILQDDPPVYNLGFGDEDFTTGMINDITTTNNNDRDKVLATVANTIIDFCNHHGDHFIYAEGSTPARTRLYQISISNLLDNITNEFDIYGLRNNEPEVFQRNVNYHAFLIRRK